MAAALSVSISSADADYVSRELRDMPRKIPTIYMRAINRAIESAKTKIPKEIQGVTTIREKGRVVKDTIVKLATKDRLVGTLDFYGRAIGAIEFKHRVYKRRGVSVQFMKKDAPIIFSHGFKGTGLAFAKGSTKENPIYSTESGNTHLWGRRLGTWHKVQAAHHKPNIGREMEKIRPFYGPSLTRIYIRNPEIKERIEKQASETMHKRIISQVNLALGRKKTPVLSGVGEL